MAAPRAVEVEGRTEPFGGAGRAEECDIKLAALDGAAGPPTAEGAELWDVEAPEDETGSAAALPRNAPAGRTMSAQTTNTIGSSQIAFRPNVDGDIADGDEAP